MAKAGRKRKPGPRTKSGRLAVPFEENSMQTVLQARRRHQRPPHEPTDAAVSAMCERTGLAPYAAREALSQRVLADDKKPVTKEAAKTLRRLGTVLHAMAERGQISEAERAAGDDYAARHGRYTSLNGLPSPHPKGASIDATGGASTRPERLRAAAAAKADHMRDAAILRQCGAGVAWAVHRACIMDMPAPPLMVREGLAQLVAHNR